MDGFLGEDRLAFRTSEFWRSEIPSPSSPLIVALGLLTGISLPHVLVAFGIFQIVWGVVYGLPISVKAMKALAALAIAGSLTYAELALAGLMLGVVLIGMGRG